MSNIFQDQINEIYWENKKFYEDERGKGFLKGVLRNFPHEWLYICELIQNAIDVKARNIRVECDHETFILEHDGEPFVQKHVKGLCRIGVSSKGVSTVGFMGIGFKSVFACFEKASINSGGYKFSLEVRTKETKLGSQPDLIGSVLPMWYEQIRPVSSGMTTRFELSDRRSSREPNVHLQQVWSAERNILPMLIANGLTTLIWNDVRWDLEKQPLHDNENQGFLLIARDHSSDSQIQWIIFNRKYYPSEIAKEEFIRHRELQPQSDQEAEAYLQEMADPRIVALFVKVDQNMVPVLSNVGYAYAMLPTDIQLPFKFNIQADWLLMTSRTQMMDADEKQWHKDIADQIPHLLAGCIQWLVQNIKAGHNLEAVYGLIPDFVTIVHDPLANWWLNKIRPGLQEVMSRSEFLPVYQNDGTLRFCLPEQVFCLPTEFKLFEYKREFKSWLLFQDRVIAKDQITPNIVESLLRIELIREIPSNELMGLCTNWQVGNWFSSLSEDLKMEAIYQLWAVLGAFEKNSLEFDASNIPCILTEKGDWTGRGLVKSMTDDYWYAFAKEDWLKRILFDAAKRLGGLVSLQIYPMITQLAKDDGDPSVIGYRYFVSKLRAFKTEELIDNWWSVVEQYPQDNFDLVIQFTGYIRVHQVQRRNLIKRFYVTDNLEKCTLEKASNVLIADPYAGAYRKTIFPGISYLCSDYHKKDIYNGSSTQWRDFLEGDKSIAPVGKFGLQTVVKPYDDWGDDLEKVKQITGLPNITLRRSWQKPVNWHGVIEVPCNKHIIIDYDMPEGWKTTLKDQNNVQAAIKWMNESPESFCLRPKHLCIQFNTSYVSETILENFEAQWLKTLKETEWVPVLGSQRLFRPAQVLLEADSLRPEADVADLPSELIRQLQDNGIEFGQEVINVPALKRLEAKGTVMKWPELLETLREAIDQIGTNAEARNVLREILLNKEILPYAQNRDDKRTTMRWVVKNNGERRSDFNKRVVSIDDFNQDSMERKVYDLIAETNIFDIPAKVDGRMALDMLLEIWSHKIPSEEVRRFMPSAFQYLMEEIEDNQSLREQWHSTREAIRVYCGRMKGWVEVDEALFDDRKSTVHDSYLKDLTIATPSFFGKPYDQQIKTAQFIGLKLLSEKIEIRNLIDEEIGVDRLWSERICDLCEIARDILSHEQDEEEEVEVEEEVQVTTIVEQIVRCQKISTVIVDLINQTELEKHKRLAVLEEKKIYVCGEPHDFAPELSEVIIELLGLGRKTDTSGKIKRLTAKLGTALAYLNDEDKYLAVIRNIIDAYGMGNRRRDQVFRGADETAAAKEEAAVTENSQVETVGDNTYVSEVGEDSFAKNEIDDDEVNNSDSSRTNSKSASESQGKKRYQTVLGHGSGGYSQKARRKRDKSLAQRLESRLNSSPIPKHQEDDLDVKTPKSDKEYRDAVMRYERERGRSPKEMPELQEGFDIESCDQNGKLRRIEVKGRSAEWRDDEIVTMSKKQIETFFNSPEECWLYIVEKLHDDRYRISPIRNPARRAKTFEFTATLWKFTVQDQAEINTEEDVALPDYKDFSFGEMDGEGTA